jgi:hypothetical protein
MIFYTATHELNSNLQFIAVGALSPVVGVANALIHVRIALGRTIEQMSKSTMGSSLASAPIRFVPGPGATPMRSGGGGRETVNDDSFELKSRSGAS